MLQGDEHYVIVKLTSGEQLMAILEHESENNIHLVYPMLIRTIPVLDVMKETVTATPYSQFADDAHITINKQHVIYLKNLHHMLIPHFTKLVDENEKQVLVSRNNDGSVKRAEDLRWDEYPSQEQLEEIEKLSTEEIKRRIDMLESIFGREEETTEEETKEDKRTFVDGNDTLH